MKRDRLTFPCDWSWCGLRATVVVPLPLSFKPLNVPRFSTCRLSRPRLPYRIVIGFIIVTLNWRRTSCRRRRLVLLPLLKFMLKTLNTVKPRRKLSQSSILRGWRVITNLSFIISFLLIPKLTKRRGPSCLRGGSCLTVVRRFFSSPPFQLKKFCRPRLPGIGPRSRFVQTLGGPSASGTVVGDCFESPLLVLTPWRGSPRS